MSSANAGAEREDQQASPPPKPIPGDANDHVQGFPEIAANSASFSVGKEVKSAAPQETPNLVQPSPDSSGQVPGAAAKEVAIRLQSPSGETVNVKLVDQGGQVQVTVRSSDPEAATALRQDLSSLTGSLEKAGWKVDAPAGSAGALEFLQSTQQSRNDQPDTPGQRQPEWQQQESPRKRYTASDAWDEALTNQTA